MAVHYGTTECLNVNENNEVLDDLRFARFPCLSTWWYDDFYAPTHRQEDVMPLVRGDSGVLYLSLSGDSSDNLAVSSEQYDLAKLMMTEFGPYFEGMTLTHHATNKNAPLFLIPFEPDMDAIKFFHTFCMARWVTQEFYRYGAYQSFDLYLDHIDAPVHSPFVDRLIDPFTTDGPNTRNAGLFGRMLGGYLHERYQMWEKRGWWGDGVEKRRSLCKAASPTGTLMFADFKAWWNANLENVGKELYNTVSV